MTSGSVGQHEQVEVALIEERANALGRVGDRLEEALSAWRVAVDGDPAEREAALVRVRDAAWALIVQRECVGFRCDNLRWIRRHYDIPPEAFRMI
ncbi:MAG: hypothetical protein KY469_08415 [Actinobacteria bacterium]|nr:hypothetical protein [Actinomycetota bacterium]